MQVRTTRTKFAAVVLGLAAFTTACSSSSPSPVPQTDEFLAITDCRELERLASVEVDRISSSNDRTVVDDATARFNRIVAHRDQTC